MAITKQAISLALSLIAIGGVGLTSFLSVKGYQKASQVEDKKEKLKCYAPAIAGGVLTGACILGAYGISRKEIVALTATCGYLTANRDKLEKAAIDKLGIEGAKELKQEALVIPGQRTIESTGLGTMLIFEEYSGRLFYSSMEAVDEAEKKLSVKYNSGHRISLNDFYDLLRIERTTFGNNWGWMPDLNSFGYKFQDDNPLCFDDRIVQDTKTGKPVRIITFYNYPISNYLYEI